MLLPADAERQSRYADMASIADGRWSRRVGAEF